MNGAVNHHLEGRHTRSPGWNQTSWGSKQQTVMKKPFLNPKWAMKKKPDCLGMFGVYRGWNPTQSCGDNHCKDPDWTTQYFNGKFRHRLLGRKWWGWRLGNAQSLSTIRGAIILPTQTSRTIFQGNPSNFTIHLHCLISPKKKGVFFSWPPVLWRLRCCR